MSKVKMAAYKIYAFMTSPTFLRVVTEDGLLIMKGDVEDEATAKTLVTSPSFEVLIVEKIGDKKNSVIWEKDPAGNDALIEACRVLEEKEASGPAEEVQVEPETRGEILWNVNDGAERKAMMWYGGKYKVLPFQHLQKNDKFQLFEASGEPVLVNGESDLIAITDAANGAVDGEFCIEIKVGIEVDEKAEVEAIVDRVENGVAESKKKFETKTEEVLEVETDETFSEGKLKRMIRDVEDAKIELAGIQSDFNMRIKQMTKDLFSAAHGRSKTHVKCRIENDWENGVRKWHRLDNGEFVKEAEICYEERQLNMDLEMLENEGVVSSTLPDDVAEEIFNETEAQTVEGVDIAEGEQVGELEVLEAQEELEFTPPSEEPVEQVQEEETYHGQ